MPIYTVKEFAALTGKTPKDIHTYAGRGKVVKTDKKIDTSDDINALFLEKYGVDVVESVPEVVVKTEKPPKWATVKRETVKPEPPTKEQKEKQAQSKKMVAADLEIKNLNIRKKKSEIELEELRVKRLQGALMPKDQVLEITSTHFNSLTATYKAGLDEMLDTLITRKVIDRKEAIELKKVEVEIINKAIDDAIELTNADIEKLSKAQAQNRGYNV